jgi:transcriptional regulator with PAS, ATPase and Fis domain
MLPGLKVKGTSFQAVLDGGDFCLSDPSFEFNEIVEVLDGLIESWYMFYVIVDKEGYINNINQTLLEALELSKEDVVGKYILDVIPDCQLTKVLKTGRTVSADICCINGKETIVTALPIMHKGEVVGALSRSIFLDISAAQVILKRLEQTEQEFAVILDTLFENPHLGFVMVDKKGMITHINTPFLQCLGNLPKEAVINRYILDVIPNSELPEVLRTGRIDKAKLWYINGQETLVSRMPIKMEGEVVGAIGHYFMLDMSGARVLMDMLEENEQRFVTVINGLIESPYAAYVIVDKDATVTFMNQTYLDILEMKRCDVIGKNILEITPESKLPEVLKTGKVYQADYWPINGRETVVNRQPIVKNGDIIGAIGHSVALDMTGAKIMTRKLEQIEKELNIYKKEVWSMYRTRWQFSDLVGDSTEFSMTKDMARQFAATSSTLLITGESGTGKELFAQSIHNASRRCSGPFIRINCAALPENLLESELFGYEEGAFTGAKKGGKPGKFELAKGGTLFLDEIGDMPITMQTKLLSVLQERIVERVGGTTPIAINARIIAATNRDLEELVANHQFREDLYYRLNVVRLRIPPLRRRLDDMPLLVRDLLRRINSTLETNVPHVSAQALQLLQEYSWPGNVRELENLLERAVNLASMEASDCLLPAHFPSLSPTDAALSALPQQLNKGLAETVEMIEKEIIVRTLKQTGGNRSKTAKMLGIHSSALYRKLEKYGLNR